MGLLRNVQIYSVRSIVYTDNFINILNLGSFACLPTRQAKANLPAVTAVQAGKARNLYIYPSTTCPDFSGSK
ncbi:MAG: hypothetical protein WC868_03410 [Bacteroidales bacterium]